MFFQSYFLHKSKPHHKFHPLLHDLTMDKFVDFHKQLMQHNIDDVMSYKDFLKMFATDEETIAKINALWYCRICLE